MTKLIRISPRDAIDAFCCECMGNSGAAISDIRGCTAPKCPLFHFRPYQNEGERVGCWTPEQFEAARGYSCFSAEKRAAMAKNIITSEELDAQTKKKQEFGRTLHGKRFEKTTPTQKVAVSSPPITTNAEQAPERVESIVGG